MSRFVGGDLQARFMARVRGADPAVCLVVPVDVGKWSAMALVADHHGEIVVAPFECGLDEPGVRRLLTVIETWVTDRRAVLCRVGVESAGHYHRTMVARLRAAGVEVVELNPAQGRAGSWSETSPNAAVAVGHRAHRLAFAMLRSQDPHDPNRWAAAVADGPVMAKTGGRPTRTTLPARRSSTMTGAAAANNPSPPGELDGGGRDQRRRSYAARLGTAPLARRPAPPNE